MKIFEIEAYFDRIFPISRRCAWDHDGLLVCFDRHREVNRVLTCLDVTFDVIERAIQEGADLIVSHHPLIFEPLYTVTEDTLLGQKVLRLMEHRISLLSLHTRFDGGEGGLNAALGQLMGLTSQEEEPLIPDEPYIGAIGCLPMRTSPKELARTLSLSLLSPVTLYSAEMDVVRVGYCCGSAKSLVEPCIARGCDAFVGGDLPYHVVLSAVERGMTVIDCGHHGSEKMASALLRDRLRQEFPELDVISVTDPIWGEIIDFS